jgi:hypothetical protein
VWFLYIWHDSHGKSPPGQTEEAIEKPDCSDYLFKYMPLYRIQKDYRSRYGGGGNNGSNLSLLFYKLYCQTHQTTH